MQTAIIVLGIWAAAGCLVAPEFASIVRTERGMRILFIACGPVLWAIAISWIVWHLWKHR